LWVIPQLYLSERYILKHMSNEKLHATQTQIRRIALLNGDSQWHAPKPNLDSGDTLPIRKAFTKFRAGTEAGRKVVGRTITPPKSEVQPAAETLDTTA
jgi:hypothetical protein